MSEKSARDAQLMGWELSENGDCFNEFEVRG